MGDICVLVHNGTCTNSGGRHGGPQHREKVQQLKDELDHLGWKASEKESRVYVNDTGKYRYPDIIAENGDEKIFIQVGKAKQNGQMVAREKAAYSQLNSIHPTYFFYYN